MIKCEGGKTHPFNYSSIVYRNQFTQMEQLYGPNPRSLSSYPPVASCVTLTRSLCSVTCHRYTPSKPPPMHIMWRSTHINYAQLQLQLLVGVVEEGNEIKRNAAGEHLCKELVLSAAPPFCYDAHLVC